ncbi:MAG: hypothetical protein JXP34_20730 [Planctomycetes bacterium]|nr:hypothetical protein [Planctomycetota bacterium]
MTRHIALLAVLFAVSPAAHTPEPPARDADPGNGGSPQKPATGGAETAFSPDAIYSEVAERLRRGFDARLRDPEAYRAAADAQCRVFPEGNLYRARA